MAGTSNFVTWNPAQNNQMDDADYAASQLRSTGASAAPTPFAGNLANKLYHQTSIMAAALGQMLAAKGYTVSDNDQSQLAAVLATIVTGADQRIPQFVPNYAANLAVDVSQYEGMQVTLQGDLVIAPQGLGAAKGRRFLLITVQDGTGGHAVTLQGAKSQGAVAPDPNSYSIQEFVVEAGGTLLAVTGVTTYP